MSGVQRYTADGYGAQQGEMMPDPEGPWMLAADHARIVAERVAEVTDALIDARREALAELEQAHAAALAEAEAASTVAVGMTVEAALAECIVEVVRVDSFEDIAGHFLKDRDEVEDAIRRVFHKWANKAAAPRTLTADDPGYHSQRCLHCDHIRAAHALTASGCLGHAVPGREGAYCPCSEFISDGEATPQVKPCSTCGEPVAYLTARPGWAGGWLHHPARPLDGHPAAIDGEATT